jgi:hypothetical protein
VYIDSTLTDLLTCPKRAAHATDARALAGRLPWTASAAGVSTTISGRTTFDGILSQGNELR